MSEMLRLEGFIKDVRYRACVTTKDVTGNDLPIFDLDTFDINAAPPYGLLRTPTGEGTVGYSKWVSPKRTRSYPFERIYNTYNAPKILTVIPIIKDEGADGDLDKIGWMTFSWMNLLNIYIVLAYYESAEKNLSPKQRRRQKLTKQKFNADFINAQIAEIVAYHQSALHWNKHLFESRFTGIFDIALRAYARISKKTGVQVHRQDELRTYLGEIKQDFSQFMTLSHAGSQRSSHSESQTRHRLEHLGDGDKALFHIENYLGGIYYLTADEAFKENSTYVIQECKNSSKGVLPSLGDIRDGLFKLILFANLDWLSLGGNKIKYVPRLKLTSAQIIGKLRLPCSNADLAHFLDANRPLNARHKKIIACLANEVRENPKLTIEIASNR